jgi:hypothetical protein
MMKRVRGVEGSKNRGQGIKGPRGSRVKKEKKKGK